MSIHFDDDITSRIERQRKQQMAAMMGKTVAQMEEDNEYFNEIKEIETQDQLASYESNSPKSNGQAVLETPDQLKTGFDRIRNNLRLDGPILASDERFLSKDGHRFVPEPIPFTKKHQAEIDRQEEERERKEALQNRYLPGAGQSPKYMGEAPPEERSPTGIPAQRDPFVREEMERQALQEEAAPQFSRYEIPEYGEEEKPGMWEQTTAWAKEKFPTLRSQEEVEAGLREKAERQGTGLTDAWQDDPNIQEEIGKRESMAEYQRLAKLDEPGGLLDDLRAEKRAGEFADTERDENSPAVKQMKEVQNNPEDRKKIFKGMSKEETAMAKEELGNYYIGPGGYAINLDEVEADSKRGANFLMLQHIPVHARAQMLASWGYIDQEDVDNLPENPTVAAAQVKADGELAKQISINKTDLTKTDKTTKSVLDVTKYQVNATERMNTQNNVTKKALQLSNYKIKELQIDSNEWMFLDELELKEYMHLNGIELEGDKLAVMESHQLATINLGYSKIKSAEKIEQNLLTQRGTEWKDKYNAMTTQEKRAAVLQAHTQSMDVITMAMGSGQIDLAAIVAAEMGLAWMPDIDAYWKSNSASSAMDPAIKGILKKHYPLMKGSVVAGKYSSEKSTLFRDLRKPKGEMDQYSNLDNWIREDPTRGKPWDDMIPTEKKQYKSREHWKATKLVEAVHHGLQNGAYSEYHKVVTNRLINIDAPGTAGKTGTNETGGDTKTKIKTKIEPPVVPEKGTEKGALPGEPKSEVSPKSGQYSFREKLTNARNNLFQQFKDSGGASVIAGQMVGKKRLEKPGEKEKVMTQVRERGRKRLKQLFSRPPSKTGKYTRLLPSEIKSEKAALKYYEKNPAKLDKLSPEVQIYVYTKLANLTEKAGK